MNQKNNLLISKMSGVNLFQGWVTPQQKKIGLNRQQHYNQTAPIQRPKKMKLMMMEQDKEDPRDDRFDPKLVMKAMNNSFTKRMSGHQAQKFQIDELLLMINQYVFDSQKLHQAQGDISQRMWYIVELDEHILKNIRIGELSPPSSIVSAFCGDTRTQTNHYKTIQKENDLPNSLKLYSLVLNMKNKELHFQSFSGPQNRFFINLDVVKAKIGESLPQQQSLFKPIVLQVQEKEFPLQLHIYLTRDTIPFPFSKNASENQKMGYLAHHKKSLYFTLLNSIRQSRGNEFRLRKAIEHSLKNQTRFYNDRFVSEEQFANFCQTGDIILFRDSHTMAKVQRAITNSPYDHIGVVYKCDQLGICLFQSNSGTGVGLASWRQLIRFHWFQGIEKITWRKLQLHDKPHNFQEKVTEFVKGNMHKQYGLTLAKLIKFKSVTYSHDLKSTYFCSELVAALYKFLGILDSAKSSTQYWPKDFADGNGLQILNGALDPERQVIFQHKILKSTYRFYQEQLL